MGLAALSVPLTAAGVGLGAYGAYQSTKAQQRAEDKQNEIAAQQEALRNQRRNEMGALLNQYRAQISALPTSGYSPEEIANLQSKVNYDTQDKSKGLSEALIQKFLGQNINPNSGAVAGAAANIVSDLEKNKRNQFLNIEQSSLNQKKAEEAAKRQAEQEYLSLASQDLNNITNSDIAGLNNDLKNFNTVQNQKGQQFSNLANTILSSTASMGEAPKNIIPGVEWGDVNPLRFFKRKKAADNGVNYANYMPERGF